MDDFDLPGFTISAAGALLEEIREKSQIFFNPLVWPCWMDILLIMYIGQPLNEFQ